MAGYIPWFGKKRERLAEYERDFIALLVTGADAAALSAGIDRVRAAQVRALKARRAVLKPSEKNSIAMANFGRKIALWSVMLAEAVIAHYRARLKQGAEAPSHQPAAT